MMIDTVSIVIPVYNEGDNILETLWTIENEISASFEILIVYDFDEDDTLPVVEKYINESKSENILLEKNRYGNGVLSAIRTGFDCSSHDIVMVTMADSSDDYSAVGSMLEKMNTGYDIVCGSRYMKGGRHIGGPKLKKFLSRTAGLSLHFLIGIPTHDISNSYKMYRKSVINGVKIESTGGFEIGMEIVVKAFLNGFRIGEVPVTWRDRVAGKSRFKLVKWMPEYLKWYLYALRGRLMMATGHRRDNN